MLKTSNSKLEQFKEKLYDMAIRDARKKADVLVKATAQQIDSPIVITEKFFEASEPDLDDFYYSDDTNGVFTLRLTLQVTYKVK